MYVQPLLAVGVGKASPLPSNPAHTNPLNRDPLVRSAYERLYNLDYPGAVERFQRFHAAHPGDPQATALLLTSQAQSKANLLIAQSLTPPLLQQKALDKWNGALPTYLSPGAPMPFIGEASVAGQSGK